MFSKPTDPQEIGVMGTVLTGASRQSIFPSWAREVIEKSLVSLDGLSTSKEKLNEPWAKWPPWQDTDSCKVSWAPCSTELTGLFG